MIEDGRAHYEVSYPEYWSALSSRITRSAFLRKPTLPRNPPVQSDISPVLARIERGRWLADCTDCAGADYVWLDQPVFMCPSCFNKAYDGQWRGVTMPDLAGVAEITRRQAEGVDVGWLTWDPRTQTVEELVSEL